MSTNRIGLPMIAAFVFVASGCGTSGDQGMMDAAVDAGVTDGGRADAATMDAAPSDSGPGDAAARDAGDTCTGQCAALPPPMWTGPTLLWEGAKKDAPPCPAVAPIIAREGHADLSAPNDCGTCNCGPALGDCQLPKNMTAHAAACANIGNGTPATSFDPSANWAGACDTGNGIPAGKLCAGVPCVQSLTISPLTVSENACKASSSAPGPTPPSWNTYGRACQGMAAGGCQNPMTACVPAPPPASQFQLCIYQDGDKTCPAAGGYSQKHLFYGGFEDHRACSSCSCGAPSGGACSAQVSIYTDGACSTLAFAESVDSTGPVCHDLPAGTALGSRSAAPFTYVPGTCKPSGGTPLGVANPIMPVTFCCLKSQ